MSFDAYYYSFDPTGVEEIDDILHAVATAGKMFHHTDEWSEPCKYIEGKSPVDLIQEAANKAAEIRRK